MVRARSSGRIPGVALVMFMAAAVASASTASPPQLPENAQSIGTAHMLPGGTIVLDLVGHGHGIIGDGEVRYPPADPQYRDVIEHLHGLAPGEFKSVPPWPD